MFFDRKKEFIENAKSNLDKTFWVYYGLKAAPLTLAHEEIIRKIVEEFSKYPNVKICIGCADSEFKNKFSLTDLLWEYIRSFYEDEIDIISQDGWQGLYKFFLQQSKTNNKFLQNRTLVVVGEDEAEHLSANDGVWLDAEKFMEEYFFYCAKDRYNNSISSTKVREIFYRDPDVDYFYVKDYISKWIFDYIKLNEIFWQLPKDNRAIENNFIENYDPSKFERPSVTTDFIAWGEDTENYKNKKILLIRRGGHPYKGYWALPGGFLDVKNDNTITDAAIRELCEETELSVKKPPEYYPKQFKTYGNIGTDPRMRIVDVVYSQKFYLKDLSLAKAKDDASELCLFDIDNLPKMAFNHKQIIEEFFATLK